MYDNNTVDFQKIAIKKHQTARVGLIASKNDIDLLAAASK
jgi:hypothetical protein